MILQRLGLINKNQRGFTLIELVIAIAITGAIGSGITMSIFQVLNYNALSTAHMAAVKQVENAVHWISRDAQMAQTVEPAAAPDPDGFPLVLTWVEWDNTVNVVTYNYNVDDDELERSHSKGGVPSETVVAQYISAADCGLNGGVLTFELTATVGQGSQITSETRVCEVTPRPSS